MNLIGTTEAIAEEAGINAVQDMAKIHRNITLVLESVDELGDWNFAIKPYSLTVAANKNSVSVARYSIFRLVSCIATVSGSDRELGFVHITDFKRMGTAYTTTNSSPIKYSLAGKKLYVGPGLLAASTPVTGDYRRRLTFEDLDYFESSLIIDGVLRRILQKGSPGQIAAWNGWNIAKAKLGTKASKITEEKRSVRFLDPQIAYNQNYINNLW